MEPGQGAEEAGPSFPSHMYMRQWGLPHMSADHFLGGRGLHVLRPHERALDALPVPALVSRQAYNPSVVALPQPTRRRLACPECVYAATLRVDWMTQCAGFTQRLARRQRAAQRTPFGARKRTLLMLLNESLGVVSWGWIERLPAQSTKSAPLTRPAADLFSRAALHAGLSIIDSRLFLFRQQLHVLATYPARSYASSIAPLRVRRHAGLHRLAAWVDRSDEVSLRQGACGGRSQAFFEHAEPNHSSRLLFCRGVHTRASLCSTCSMGGGWARALGARGAHLVRHSIV